MSLRKLTYSNFVECLSDLSDEGHMVLLTSRVSQWLIDIEKAAGIHELRVSVCSIRDIEECGFPFHLEHVLVDPVYLQKDALTAELQVKYAMAGLLNFNLPSWGFLADEGLSEPIPRWERLSVPY